MVFSFTVQLARRNLSGFVGRRIDKRIYKDEGKLKAERSAYEGGLPLFLLWGYLMGAPSGAPMRWVLSESEDLGEGGLSSIGLKGRKRGGGKKLR
jgi:hypothetical protein